MSLLLEALKKAEKAKEEAQRRASGEAAPVEADAGAAERQGVLTRHELPDISAPLEILPDEPPSKPSASEGSTLEALEPAAKPAATRAAAQPASPSRRGAASADEAGRATAKKVFEAKFREPNPRMPFYITVGVLGLFAVGTVVYFWYQLRPPPPLVNLNPARSAEAAVALTETPPTPVRAPAALPAREAPIPGLPSPAATPSTPTTSPSTRSATPAVPATPALTAPPRPAQRAAESGLPREEPRLAPRPSTPAAPLAGAAAEARASVTPNTLQVNPKVASGYAAYVAGDTAKARAEYEEALREEPANRDALLGLGALDVRAGRYESAEALYLRVLQADPRDAEAQAALLALRAGRSDPLATESRVKSLLAAEPGAHALNFTLGNQLAQQNRWGEAQQEYLKAYAAEPDNADFAYNVAVSFDHMHQGRQALEYYQRALALARARGASFDLAAAQARVAQLAR
jgi:tetratricopeptide (TPR) repeat protein